MNHLVGILPAAGRGSRLGPIPCSKEIMPLGFQSYLPSNHDAWHPVTTIETHLKAFNEAGVDRTGIILGGSKFDIMRYLGNGSRYGFPIAYFYQEILRGMPFALDLVYPWLAEATVLFSMPDTLITPSDTLAQLVRYHRGKSADITLALFQTKTPEKFGMVSLDNLGRVIDFVDKPLVTDLNLMWGAAVWSPSFSQFMHNYILELPEGGTECVLSDVFLQALNNNLSIEALVCQNSHYHDIGTPESFQAAVYELALEQARDENS